MRELSLRREIPRQKAESCSEKLLVTSTPRHIYHLLARTDFAPKPLNCGVLRMQPLQLRIVLRQPSSMQVLRSFAWM
jgi:hypothetical protein